MRLIDADELKVAVRNQWSDLSDRVEINSIINSQPTVNPVKHGRWIRQDVTCVFSCSECGFYFGILDEEGMSYYNYCQRCGAKMDEVSEGERAEPQEA